MELLQAAHILMMVQRRVCVCGVSDCATALVESKLGNRRQATGSETHHKTALGADRHVRLLDSRVIRVHPRCADRRRQVSSRAALQET